MTHTADYIYYNGELYHASKKRKTKYIAKVPISNGKYRYFYTQEEYDAYKNSKKPKESKLKSKLKSVSKFFKNISKKISKLFKKSKTELGKTLAKGRKFVNEVIFGKKKGSGSRFDIKEKIHKYIARVKMSNGKYKYFYDSAAYERYLKRMKYQTNEPDFMKKVPKISESKDYTAEEDMAEINEKYSPYDDANSLNCANCTTAYELRCRGYDVEAAPYEGEFSYLDNGTVYRYSKYYKDAHTITLNSEGGEHESILNGTKLQKEFDYDANTVEQAIIKHSGKNTRGDISVSWKSGSAHSMVYEVDSKGSVVIRDCQTNDVYSVANIVDLVNNIRITRTDNLELKKGILDAVEDN